MMIQISNDNIDSQLENIRQAHRWQAGIEWSDM